MKRTTILAAGLFVIGALALSACGGGGATPTQTPGTTPPGPATAAAANVSISNFAFSPAEVQVAVGDTVEWTNEDSTDHTVTGDGWDSGTLSQGQSYRQVFEKAGTYSYHCSVHPSMKGTVTVK